MLSSIKAAKVKLTLCSLVNFSFQSSAATLIKANRMALNRELSPPVRDMSASCAS